MADWLTRATSLFQQSTPLVETYEVQCDCGGKVSGQRTRGYQKPACPNCERMVFVLPANVYPRPKVKVPKKGAKGGKADKTARGPSTVVIDENPEVSATKPQKKGGLPKGHAAQSHATAPSQLPREPVARLITPLRLVSVAIFLVSVATVAGLWHRQRLEAAKAIVAQATDRGMAALHESDFVQAAAELEKARAAVDLLGRVDVAAREIRRHSREATALSKLATNTLAEVLDETFGNRKPGSEEPLRLSSSNSGAWMIFDANLIPASDDKIRCIVDGPVLMPQAVVKVEIESSQLRKMAEAQEGGELARVIFAAQIDQLSVPKGEPLTSVMTLNGKTAFLWTSYDTYAAIGYRPFDSESEQQTRAVLDRQLESSNR